MDLADWVKRWAGAYDDAYDRQLAPLWGKRELNAADRELVARWKFQSDGRRLQRTLNLLARNDQRWADELARRAWRATTSWGRG